MANTFLLAQGKKIGKSLNEKTMIKTAKKIMSNASRKKYKIILPVDAVVANNLKVESSPSIILIIFLMMD